MPRRVARHMRHPTKMMRGGIFRAISNSRRMQLSTLGTILYTVLLLSISVSTLYYIHTIKAATQADMPAFTDIPKSQCLHWSGDIKSGEVHREESCPAERFYFNYFERIPLPLPPQQNNNNNDGNEKKEENIRRYEPPRGGAAQYSLEEMYCDWALPQRPSEVNSTSLQRVFVFFIPGNSGRGTQAWYLSCVMALQARTSNMLMRHVASGPPDAAYEMHTYTFDFAHEANVHRGKLLGLQADYVADRIVDVMTSQKAACEEGGGGTTNKSTTCAVWIVGHSMGGIVARTARVLLREVLPVRGVVTVNSPHAHPPLFLDGAMERLYKALAFIERKEDEDNKRRQIATMRQSSLALREENHDTACFLRPRRAIAIIDYHSPFMQPGRDCITKGEQDDVRRNTSRQTMLWSFTSGEMDLQIEPRSTWLPLLGPVGGTESALRHNVNWFAPQLCDKSRSHDEALHDVCGLTLIAKVILCSDRLRRTTPLTGEVDSREKRYHDECDYLLHNISVTSPAALNAQQLDNLFYGIRAWLALWGRLCTQHHMWPMTTTMGIVYLMVPDVMKQVAFFLQVGEKGTRAATQHHTIWRNVLLRSVQRIIYFTVYNMARYSVFFCTALFYLVLYRTVMYNKKHLSEVQRKKDCVENSVTLLIAAGPLLVGHWLARVVDFVLRVRVRLNVLLIRCFRRYVTSRPALYDYKVRIIMDVTLMLLGLVMSFEFGLSRDIKRLVWLELSEFLVALLMVERKEVRARQRDIVDEMFIAAGIEPGPVRCAAGSTKSRSEFEVNDMIPIHYAFIQATLYMPFFTFRNAINDDVVTDDTSLYPILIMWLIIFQYGRLNLEIALKKVNAFNTVLVIAHAYALAHAFANYRSVSNLETWGLVIAIFSISVITTQTTYECVQQLSTLNI